MHRLFAICCILCGLYTHVAQAADATSFDPTPIPVVSQGISGVPIGTVIAWPSSTLPRATNGVIPNQGACVAAVSDEQAEALGCEWLKADGSVLNPTAYPDLSAATGPQLPDYRGVFLRGHGSVSSAHYGTVTHTSGDLGTLQGDSVRNITGGMYGVASMPNWQGALIGNGETGSSNVGLGSYHARLGSIYFDASRVVPVANENRPVNRSVVYLVKAR